MIVVRGVVQGVGFRPFVYQLATRLRLAGCVKNQAGEVRIEVEGLAAVLDQFQQELRTSPPVLAQIRDISCEEQLPSGQRGFQINDSASIRVGDICIAPDTATCAECLAELFEPTNRRYRYPFLNCTNCGPRLTIIQSFPYNRIRTTMASFPKCAECRREYEDHGHRRVHAQPTACAACGPYLEIWNAAGEPLACADPVQYAVAAFRAGLIGAVKGLGGYHLVSDATQSAAVRQLRLSKHRDEKPFAIMVADLAVAETLCDISAAERELLCSPRRPIVLLRRRASCGLAEELAPKNPWLGVMLPYTPLHHLLLAAMQGTPLVMTSGNRSDEPMAFADEVARTQLAGIADFYLTHNRPIHLRCDDSVTCIVANRELPLRRARGEAPLPIPLPRACSRPILAVGGQQKTTFALGLAGSSHAIVSQHLGDLDQYEAYRAYTETILHYAQLWDFEPVQLVHDLHPDYASTRYARERAASAPAAAIQTLAVQHHHAHLASCMADNGLHEPVIGVIWDGTGLGTDGAIWGGEFLIGDYRQFYRAAHLRYVDLPGNEQAIREPWRMALAHLLDAEQDLAALPGGLDPVVLAGVIRMCQQKFHTSRTSSMGRLFDAVAVLAGGRPRVSFEGQAAIEWEWLASEIPAERPYAFAIQAGTMQTVSEHALQIDTRPLIAAVVRDVQQQVSPPIIARRFHTTLVEIVAQVCDRLREETGTQSVVLSGGVWMNANLLTEATDRLQAAGFRVYRHRQVPPNDGGLSLGQLAIATAWDGQKRQS